MNENQQEKLVLVDGEIMPEAEAFIDVNDRGHNFGDGVFEIVPVYNGRCFALLPHMNNLFDSVIAVKIPGVYMIEELVEFHESLLAATGLKDCEIYTQVTRGSGAYALSYPEQSIPHLTMYAVPVDREALAEKRAKGVNVITVEDVRWARCDINTLNRLPEVMAKQRLLLAMLLIPCLFATVKLPKARKPASSFIKTVFCGLIPKTTLFIKTLPAVC